MSAVAVWTLPTWKMRLRPTPRGASATSSPKLDLRTEAAGQNLRVTWDRDSPALTSAVSGLLTLQDARGRKQIFLEPNQLLRGSILYQPYGDQLLLELSLMSSKHTFVSESVIVVLPTEPAGLKAVPSQKVAAQKVAAQKVAAQKVAQKLRAVEPAAPARAARIDPRPLQPFVPPQNSTSNTIQNPQTAAAGAPRSPNTRVFSAIAPSGERTPVPVVELKPQDLPVLQSQAAPVFTPPVSIPIAPPSRPVLEPPPTPSRSPNFRPPHASTQVMPHADPAIRSMLVKPIEIEVKMQIDAQGRVVQAEVTQPLKGFNQHLGRAAVEAALRWKFIPAQIENKTVPSVQNVKFLFRP